MPSKRRIVYIRRRVIKTKPKDILASLVTDWGNSTFAIPGSASTRVLNGLKKLYTNGSDSLVLVMRDKTHFKRSRRKYIETLEKLRDEMELVIERGQGLTGILAAPRRTRPVPFTAPTPHGPSVGSGQLGQAFEFPLGYTTVTTTATISSPQSWFRSVPAANGDPLDPNAGEQQNNAPSHS